MGNRLHRKKINHQKTLESPARQKPFHAINEEYDDDTHDGEPQEQLIAITFNVILFAAAQMEDDEKEVEAREAFANLKVKLPKRSGNDNLPLKIDTGAAANALPFRLFRHMFPDKVDENGKPRQKYLTPTKHTLLAYNKTKIECAGTIRIYCKFQNSEWKSLLFFVVNVPGPAILGLPSSKQMNVISFNCEISTPIRDIVDLVKHFPSQFDQIGKFNMKQKLVVDHNIPAKVNAPRRVPIALKDAIKQELKTMEEQKVIKRIKEPTDWVSSLTYVKKTGWKPAHLP